jgi:hypothetical protein
VADNKNNSDEQELLRAVLSSPAVGVPHAADEETRQTFMDRRRDQAEAYGQFVAKGPIYWPGTGTLVFSTHAQVPIEHVEKWFLEEAGLVERVASPEAARHGVHPSAYVVETAIGHQQDAEGAGGEKPSKAPAAKSTSSNAK